APDQSNDDPRRASLRGTGLTGQRGRGMHHCQEKCRISISEPAKPPAGPNPYLVSPEETLWPLKAPQRP
ncbi:Bacteriocin, partial [Dissostichus eleginoides]